MAGRPITASEVQQLTDLPRPTCYRLLHSMQAEQLLDEVSSGRFIVGESLVRLALLGQTDVDICRSAAPTLQRAADDLGEAVFLSRFRNRGVEIIHVEGRAMQNAHSCIQGSGFARCMLVHAQKSSQPLRMIRFDKIFYLARCALLPNIRAVIRNACRASLIRSSAAAMPNAYRKSNLGCRRLRHRCKSDRLGRFTALAPPGRCAASPKTAALKSESSFARWRRKWAILCRLRELPLSALYLGENWQNNALPANSSGSLNIANFGRI